MNAREQIIQAISSNPDLTSGELSELCGVSRQRIHQILREEGIRAADGRKKFRDGKNCTTRATVVTGGIQLEVGFGLAGKISEMLVVADLMARGYAVFYPLSGKSKYDLLALDKDTFNILKIEVKTGKRDGGGSLIYNKSDYNRIANPDHYAIVVRGEPVIYKPDIQN